MRCRPSASRQRPRRAPCPPRPDGRGGGRPFPPLVDDPNGILALPAGFSYTIVTREGVTDLSFGQGKTPAFHDGTAVVAAATQQLTLIQNHEMTPFMSTFGVPHVAGTVYDPGAVNASGCTVITTRRRGGRRRVGGHLRHRPQLRRRRHPVGHLADLRGDLHHRGRRLVGRRPDRHLREEPRLRLRGLPGHSEHQLPKPIKAFGRFEHEALAVEPRPEARLPLRGRQRPERPRSTGGPHRAAYDLGPGLANRLGDTAGTLEAMQIRLDDGSILPDVAYITSAQLGRPFKVTWTEVPDRDATTPIRSQFADGTVTRGKKFEGVWSNGTGAYIVNSFAFGASDLPADATKHDGMVWFYDYSDETITLVTYFPHNPLAEGEGPFPKYADLTFDGPDNVSVTPWGTLVLAEDGVRASHVLSAVPGGPTYAIARNQLSNGTSQRCADLLGVHRPDVLARRQDPVRQHPEPGHHPGHHRPLVQVPRLTAEQRKTRQA